MMNKIAIAVFVLGIAVFAGVLYWTMPGKEGMTIALNKDGAEPVIPSVPQKEPAVSDNTFSPVPAPVTQGEVLAAVTQGEVVAADMSAASAVAPASVTPKDVFAADVPPSNAVLMPAMAKGNIPVPASAPASPATMENGETLPTPAAMPLKKPVSVVSFEPNTQKMLTFQMKGPDCKELLDFMAHYDSIENADYQPGISVTGKPVVSADYVPEKSTTGKKVVSAELKGKYFVLTEQLEQNLSDFTFPVALVLKKSYPYLQSDIESGAIPLVSVRVKDGVVWLNGLPTSDADRNTLAEACLKERKKSQAETRIVNGSSNP